MLFPLGRPSLALAGRKHEAFLSHHGIINLEKADYCPAYGDASVEDSDELILMEANDNHVENHTVLEFINWCLCGRDEG